MSMRGKYILLVEDNDDHATLALRALRRSNVIGDVVVVRDGVEALNFLFAARDPLPVVVLLDLQLPRLNGLDVLQRVRANDRTRLLPVVVLSSSDEECDMLNSYQSGANSYVRKPVDFLQFMEATRQVGQYWTALNEPAPVA